MKTFGAGLLVFVSGYLAGAVAAFAAIQISSSNVHDRSVEAVMTAAFVAGPIAAVSALAVWAIYRSVRQPERT